MSGLKGTYQTPLTEVSTTDKEGLGTLRLEGGKWYKWVKLLNDTATVAVAAGTLVAYDALTGYVNNIVVADLTDADTAPFCAGATVAVAAGTLDVAYYLWIQIKGAIVLDTAVTGGAAGEAFYLTTTDRTAADRAAVDDQIAGICYNTTTGVVLDCPF